MTMTPQGQAHLAIEVMTAWADAPDGPPDLLVGCLRRLVDDHPEDDRRRAACEIMMSLTYLCGSLLVLREFETGVDAGETLRELALHCAER